MASFSRGMSAHHVLFLVPKSSCPCAAPSVPRFFFRSRTISQKRLFQTLPQLRASAKPSRAIPKPPSSRPAPVTTASKPQQLSFAEQLATRSSPTLLYEAPSHFWYTFSSVNAGLVCFGYAAFHYLSVYLYPPPDLAWWIPHAFGVICIAMGSMGAYFVLGASRVIRTINAVPASLVAGGKLPASTRPPPRLYIEIAARRLVPFTPLKKTLVAPEEVVLPYGLRAMMQGGARPPAQTAGQQIAARRAEQEKLKAEKQYEMDHLLTAPFRHFGKAVRLAWRGVVRGVTRDGFLKIKVKGYEYKLDVTGGWALDGGRGLDRLVTVRNSGVTGAVREGTA